jgi:N-acetylglucosaminyl-diphospho-decaprenol L-rhamnosyltransferase
MTTHKRLLVVIVNYCSANLVCQNLTALLPQLCRVRDSVVIVDNDSDDGSDIVLSRYIEKHDLSNHVSLTSSQHNGGFSYGNNLAIRSALTSEEHKPEFVLLLNPDTCVLDSAIDELINFMEQHPKAGIAGSRLEGADEEIQCSAFRFHSLWSELESSLRLGFISKVLAEKKVSMTIPTKASRTDWVAGASMLIRSNVFDDAGLMDEGYFLYFEETDFCLQAKRQGWQTWYVPESRVIHYVGQSTGIVSGDGTNRRRPKYWFDARQRYFRKNHGIYYTLLVDFIWGSGFAFWRIRRKIQNKPDSDPKNMLFDFWKNSSWFSFLSRPS